MCALQQQYTAYDIALTNDSREPRNVQLVRAMERRALFAGSVELKARPFPDAAVNDQSWLLAVHKTLVGLGESHRSYGRWASAACSRRGKLT